VTCFFARDTIDGEKEKASAASAPGGSSASPRPEERLMQMLEGDAGCQSGTGRPVVVSRLHGKLGQLVSSSGLTGASDCLIAGLGVLAAIPGFSYTARLSSTSAPCFLLWCPGALSAYTPPCLDLLQVVSPTNAGGGWSAVRESGEAAANHRGALLRGAPSYDREVRPNWSGRRP